MFARGRAAIENALCAYEQRESDPEDLALVHGDLGLHNMAIDPATRRVQGVFDYGEAAWTDRHLDFRYFVFDFGKDDLFDAARQEYERRTGRAVSPGQVLLANAACAAGFLAYRAGVPAQEKSCGRTLDEDLRWMRAALARLDNP